MSELEKLLESVAIECLNQPQEPSSGYLRDVRTVLWRRLLPLLEAGQAMRELRGLTYISQDWDNALAAARRGGPDV